MKKYKRALLHGLLASVFAFMPVAIFGSSYSEAPEIGEVHIEKAQFRVGVYFGRPYGYYRPYYRPYSHPYYYRSYPYYDPYRSYYY